MRPSPFLRQSLTALLTLAAACDSGFSRLSPPEETGPSVAYGLWSPGTNDTIRAWGGNTLASDNTGFPLDAASITGMRVGINGGFSATGTQYVYWGGFAVCADWCGAYSSF